MQMLEERTETYLDSRQLLTALNAFKKGDFSVRLDFGENGVNHAHQDSLCMQIYGYGHSLIDDFTYHKSILRRYGEMSLVHQTVIIDHENQNRANTAGCEVQIKIPACVVLTGQQVKAEKSKSALKANLKYTPSK